MEHPLFRKEVLSHQGERLAGRLILNPPVSYLLITVFITITTVTGLLFLIFNDYSRKQPVHGILIPDNGIIHLRPLRVSTLSEILVSEGEHVPANTPLFSLQREQGYIEAQSVTDQLLHEIESQEALLTESKIYERNFLDSILAEQQASIDTIESEISQIESLIQTQEALAVLESQAFIRAQTLYSRRMISPSDLDAAQKRQLEVQMQLQNLDLRLTQKTNMRHEAEINRETIFINSQRTLSDINSRLTDLSKQKTQTLADKTITIQTPVSGRVTSIASDIGHQLDPDQTVISLIPDNSVLEAQLYVPTRAIGFIKAGQNVNIRYEAFPYQRFGVYAGTVQNISSSVLTLSELPDEINLNEPVYKVSVSLNEQSINAFGELVYLKPGMLLSADIILAKRSLLEWLLEPLYSLRGTL